jgi:hypothetical protein
MNTRIDKITAALMRDPAVVAVLNRLATGPREDDALLTQRPGWRVALPDETPGELVPELARGAGWCAPSP